MPLGFGLGKFLPLRIFFLALGYFYYVMKRRT